MTEEMLRGNKNTSTLNLTGQKPEGADDGRRGHERTARERIRALVKLGAAGMSEVVRRLAAGATAQQLGIAWRPPPAPEVLAKLQKTLVRPDEPFPLAEIKQLTGTARQLAEAIIVIRLEAWDERVPDALVELDAAWTAPALAELADSDDAPEEMGAKLTEAARKLATS